MPVNQAWPPNVSAPSTGSVITCPGSMAVPAGGVVVGPRPEGRRSITIGLPSCRVRTTNAAAWPGRPDRGACSTVTTW
jgi:hypothetical protein